MFEKREAFLNVLLRALVLGALIHSTHLVAKSGERFRDLRLFKVESHPSSAEWRFFMSASNKWRMRLWKAQVALGKSFHDWSWEWRIGWLKTCVSSQSLNWCEKRLSEGLSDKALVVRAEAVSAIAKRWWGSGNIKMREKLVSAYRNKANMRGGKPLYIQKRILFAILRLGGDGYRETAERLAATNEETKEYWKKLRAIRM